MHSTLCLVIAQSIAVHRAQCSCVFYCEVMKMMIVNEVKVVVIYYYQFLPLLRC